MIRLSILVTCAVISITAAQLLSQSTQASVVRSEVFEDPFSTIDSASYQALLVQQFPWLSVAISSSMCEEDSVELFKSGSYYYLLVHIQDDEDLYGADGIHYCRNKGDFDCLELYFLSDKISTWKRGEEESYLASE